MQGVKDKEVIAGELAAAEASLSATPRGAALMRKYGKPHSLLICPAAGSYAFWPAVMHIGWITSPLVSSHACILVNKRALSRVSLS